MTRRHYDEQLDAVADAPNYLELEARLSDLHRAGHTHQAMIQLHQVQLYNDKAAAEKADNEAKNLS